ncbi:MAG: preprotein translocase subunit SecE [Anaerolineales bacterium]|nr:preprotein translocase subunit SecE [Anaerolineales bacterium]
MRKVTWPTREDTIRLTRLVLAVTVVFSITLGLLDVFLGWWFRQALEDETIFLLVAAAAVVVGGTFSWFAIFQREDYSPF